VCAHVCACVCVHVCVCVGAYVCVCVCVNCVHPNSCLICVVWVLCVCTCVHVCARAREIERERETARERESVCVCACVCGCMCVSPNTTLGYNIQRCPSSLAFLFFLSLSLFMSWPIMTSRATRMYFNTARCIVSALLSCVCVCPQTPPSATIYKGAHPLSRCCALSLSLYLSMSWPIMKVHVTRMYFYTARCTVSKPLSESRVGVWARTHARA